MSEIHDAAGACEPDYHRGMRNWDTCRCGALTQDKPKLHVHVIPVDVTLTPQEAWDELCLMGVRATNTGSEGWATVTCDGSHCHNIAEETT